MKIVCSQIDFSIVSVRNLDAFRVRSIVEFGAYRQTITCPRIGDEIKHDFVADQRLASPVHADKGKQAVFYSIPFACPGRKVADSNRYTDLVGKSLQLELPEPHPCAIASTAVSRYEQFRRVGISPYADTLPPPSNGLYGEGSGVMIDSDRYPSGIRADIIDAIRIG